MARLSADRVYYVISSSQSWISAYAPLISMGGVLVSALVAWLVAHLHIKNARRIAEQNVAEQRRIARRRTTLEFISKREWDSDYLHNRMEFNRLKNDVETGLEFWVRDNQKNSPQLNVIRTILNDYELVAIGVLEEDLDDDLYRSWYKSTLINDFDKCRNAIETLRARLQNEQIFCRFEALAARWKQHSD
ncbi:DUF4760 domain-containing protein [Paracoccus caeni]|uniref:DUF4760 domain-containing protein n=1 Tax=Paracoccus caeni TaxID=657651 RepID=A0A934SB84_9RHOB|nr:DUF4760 domain-containing protein [Paracoccus caeni]MBK4215720.1 DUF4760 domain-containing protein [Paracoccus caeni]